MTPSSHTPEQEPRKHVALVHVLTPEFHGLDPVDFDDIPDSQVERAAPDLLRKYLVDVKGDAVNTVWYRPALSNRSLNIAVTPYEYRSVIIRNPELFARQGVIGALAAKDVRVHDETDNKDKRARTTEDIRSARRGGMRQLIARNEVMKSYIQDEVTPRLDIIGRFLEMTKAGHENLARGSEETVQSRYEELRIKVFGDMIDAIGLAKGWSTEELFETAKKTVQKRLYISGSNRQRVHNFQQMLFLAKEYHEHKFALLKTQVSKAEEYKRKYPDVIRDIQRVDEERQRTEQETLRTE